ncbi:MAG TPA: LPS export ABC transporter periplasmic protein LptC [Candidatus Cloacimonadota bacterium]|nr:LPS export ABC transporter periplasmic protein LptC [Candidatus Cloacimonadales bacterium]HPY96510.1 LPS export ABC transporter periplasmic protein LptC [Candidatus Cloacimonadota bacterium]HQB41167.1 LPS export ABC transporter periplasmic protein LptC [Candidatus Cloacimonadota bacterium]
MNTVWRLILSTLILMAMLIFSACDLSSNIPYNSSADNEPATEIIDSVYVIATDGANLDWKLDAEKIERYPDKRLLIAYQVRFESMPSEFSQKSTMTCKEAQIDEISNKIIGKGNVIIKTPNGILKTEYLTLNRFNNEVFAPGYVYMERFGNVIKGTGLTTNINFDYVNLQKVSGEGSGSGSLFD